MLTIASTEVLQLLRNRIVVISAILLPLGVAAYFVFLADVRGTVALTAAALAMMTMVTGSYVAVTTTVVVRRETSVIKRLRSGSVSDGTILAGLAGPLTALNLGQVLLIIAGLALSTRSVPESPFLLVVAALLLQVTLVGFALATSRFTNSAEQSQMTTLPLFAAFMVGAAWAAVAGPTEFGVLPALMPGGGFAELVIAGWQGADLFTVLAAITGSVTWAVLGCFASRALFRWDRRA